MQPGFRAVGGAVLALAALAAAARAGAEWGGSYPPGQRNQLRLHGGAVTRFEGMVAETTRKFYDATGQTWKQDDAETYGTSDFNLDGPYGLFGLSGEAMGRYVGFRLETSFFQPSTRTTARRDYYLAVGDDIEYGGRRYDHLMIPAGTSFEAELIGNATELDLRLVPVGFALGDRWHVNPSLELGVLFFGGKYDIDAGASTGTTQYQNPPEDFVVGGRGTGYAGLLTPQWGPGLDVRYGAADGVRFGLQGQVLFFDYDGGTSFFTSADHREKNLDFTHRNYRLRGQLEWPLQRTTLSLGVLFQWVDAEGTLESQATDPEEIVARRERFDKEFSFELETVLATLGVTF